MIIVGHYQKIIYKTYVADESDGKIIEIQDDTPQNRPEMFGFREDTYSRNMLFLRKMPHVRLANAFR